MLRGIISKVAWIGRATVFPVGLAVIVALVLGVASTATWSLPAVGRCSLCFWRSKKD